MRSLTGVAVSIADCTLAISFNPYLFTYSRWNRGSFLFFVWPRKPKPLIKRAQLFFIEKQNPINFLLSFEFAIIVLLRSIFGQPSQKPRRESHYRRCLELIHQFVLR